VRREVGALRLLVSNLVKIFVSLLVSVSSSLIAEGKVVKLFFFSSEDFDGIRSLASWEATVQRVDKFGADKTLDSMVGDDPGLERIFKLEKGIEIGRSGEVAMVGEVDSKPSLFIPWSLATFSFSVFIKDVVLWTLLLNLLVLLLLFTILNKELTIGFFGS